MVKFNRGHASFKSVPLAVSDVERLCCEMKFMIIQKSYLGTNYTERNQQQHVLYRENI